VDLRRRALESADLVLIAALLKRSTKVELLYLSENPLGMEVPVEFAEWRRNVRSGDITGVMAAAQEKLIENEMGWEEGSCPGTAAPMGGGVRNSEGMVALAKVLPEAVKCGLRVLLLHKTSLIGPLEQIVKEQTVNKDVVVNIDKEEEVVEETEEEAAAKKGWGFSKRATPMKAKQEKKQTKKEKMVNAVKQSVAATMQLKKALAKREQALAIQEQNETVDLFLNVLEAAAHGGLSHFDITGNGLSSSIQEQFMDLESKHNISTVAAAANAAGEGLTDVSQEALHHIGKTLDMMHSVGDRLSPRAKDAMSNTILPRTHVGDSIRRASQRAVDEGLVSAKMRSLEAAAAAKVHAMEASAAKVASKAHAIEASAAKAAASKVRAMEKVVVSEAYTLEQAAVHEVGQAVSPVVREVGGDTIAYEQLYTPSCILLAAIRKRLISLSYRPLRA
jgi:hypothetical protein